MATTMCEIDGRRPAVASVRIRQNGQERTIAVCEEHLRELQGQAVSYTHLTLPTIYSV